MNWDERRVFEPVLMKKEGEVLEAWNMDGSSIDEEVTINIDYQRGRSSA